jgi:predicted nucleotidyltransferase
VFGIFACRTLDAGKNSDLDLFIVGRVGADERRELSRLDEICLKAELIETTRRLKIRISFRSSWT